LALLESERVWYYVEKPSGVSMIRMKNLISNVGTYASRAAKHFGIAHIATGDLIRDEIKAKTTLGTQVGESC
jgi:adenylate kinase